MAFIPFMTLLVTPKDRRERVGERTLQCWIDAFEQPAPHGGFA
ncbi:hypothetical protein [uncultured Methylobacterium sp.]